MSKSSDASESDFGLGFYNLTVCHLRRQSRGQKLVLNIALAVKRISKLKKKNNSFFSFYVLIAPRPVPLCLVPPRVAQTQQRYLPAAAGRLDVHVLHLRYGVRVTSDQTHWGFRF